MSGLSEVSDAVFDVTGCDEGFIVITGSVSGCSGIFGDAD